MTPLSAQWKALKIYEKKPTSEYNEQRAKD